MLLLDQLRQEHDLIDSAVGAFRTWVEMFARSEASEADGLRFVRFFELFAGAYHHGREEGVLFPALVEHARLPGDRGPIAVLHEDHEAMESTLRAIGRLLHGGAPDPAALRALATRYSHALWLHIDAENFALLPESERRLPRNGVFELESRAPTPEEAAAAADGRELVGAYPPLEDGDIVRGEGCVVCPAYGDRCEGIEREWWNESEWEESYDHISAD